MYHIKESGKYLCGTKIKKGDIFISMIAANRASLEQCCSLCRSQYKNKMIGL
jgi:hypothetical protein